MTSGESVFCRVCVLRQYLVHPSVLKRQKMELWTEVRIPLCQPRWFTHALGVTAFCWILSSETLSLQHITACTTGHGRATVSDTEAGILILATGAFTAGWLLDLQVYILNRNPTFNIHRCLVPQWGLPTDRPASVEQPADACSPRERICSSRATSAAGVLLKDETF